MGRGSKIYPDQYVLLNILESHIDGDKKCVDEVALIKPIPDAQEATNELLHAKPGTRVYHTKNEEIVIEIRRRAAFRLFLTMIRMKNENVSHYRDTRDGSFATFILVNERSRRNGSIRHPRSSFVYNSWKGYVS
ncbi:hypothetical protein [Halalkalibacter wakoensis]|uniref:hypothetical protein n=1 Tax=Halalkalibacter wakoensis TaxID=127891 RepID=UPI000AE5AFE4|nr:hypothetical protein [Halalkalibacter wakoensis]